MTEAQYQNDLIKRLYKRFPGCAVFKNDPDYIQGVPDLTLLWNNKWALLEVKISFEAPLRPNQEYYITLFDQMSFAAVIYPENEEEVLLALEHSFVS